MIFVFLNKACLQVFTVSKCYGHTMEVRTRGRTITEINSRIVSNWHHYLPSQTKSYLLFPFNVEFGFRKMYSIWNFNLCTFDLYGPMCNAFYAGSIHYKGKWEGVGPWKSRLFWALWNGIEPIGKCHFWAQKSCIGGFMYKIPWVTLKGYLREVSGPIPPLQCG